MSQTTMTHFAPARTVSNRGWTHLANAVSVMFRTWTTRHDLPQMTARELADIGVSRATAMAEARRLPWDLKPLF